MEKFGDFFPGAENLEDVIRMMAERAAAAEAMFNSLSAEQQGELRALFDQMMQNMELNFSMNRLVSNLRQATPDIDWNRAHRMRGQDGSPFAQAASVAEQLGRTEGSRGVPRTEPRRPGAARSRRRGGATQPRR